MIRIQKFTFPSSTMYNYSFIGDIFRNQWGEIIHSFAFFSFPTDQTLLYGSDCIVYNWERPYVLLHNPQHVGFEIRVVIDTQSLPPCASRFLVVSFFTVFAFTTFCLNGE